MSEYATPSAPGGGVDWATLKGSLVLVTVHAQEHGVKTAYGDADPVRADIAVIDGVAEGEVHTDTLIFPKVLISQLKGQVGKKVLGRIGQGNAKPGQSAPWLLDAPLDGDAVKAKAFEAKHAADGYATADDAPPF